MSTYRRRRNTRPIADERRTADTEQRREHTSFKGGEVPAVVPIRLAVLACGGNGRAPEEPNSRPYPSDVGASSDTQSECAAASMPKATPWPLPALSAHPCGVAVACGCALTTRPAPRRGSASLRPRACGPSPRRARSGRLGHPPHSAPVAGSGSQSACAGSGGAVRLRWLLAPRGTPPASLAALPLHLGGVRSPGTPWRGCPASQGCACTPLGVSCGLRAALVGFAPASETRPRRQMAGAAHGKALRPTGSGKGCTSGLDRALPARSEPPLPPPPGASGCRTFIRKKRGVDSGAKLW